MRKRFCRSLLIFFVAGSLLSAQQVRSDTVFSEKGMVDLKELVMTEDGMPSGSEAVFSALPADSIEVIEIELEEEKGSSIYKEVAAVAIVAAFTTYIIITLFFSEDEETEDEGNIKDVSSFGISIPITR